MDLVLNTRQLLSAKPSERGTPVEFHFISDRQLYDTTILTVDPAKLRWAVAGNHRWYTVEAVTIPPYALPQELCLSFDCYSRTETFQSPSSKDSGATISGPRIDEVALEYLAVLSLLTREPLKPVGTRRIDGVPTKLDTRYVGQGRVSTQKNVPAGINSKVLQEILSGLANGDDKNATAILAAARLYHAAIALAPYDISTAYYSLTVAIECISGHQFADKKFDFDRVSKFDSARKIVDDIASQLGSNGVLVDDLKQALLKGEHFVGEKFRQFVTEFLPDEFWEEPDELFWLPPNLPIDKTKLRSFLSKVYGVRSNFAHKGIAFPSYVALGLSDVVPVSFVRIMGIDPSKTFLPTFPWFERLTHLVLREYLYRVVAPSIVAAREEKMSRKVAVIQRLKELTDAARKSLKRLTDEILKYRDMAAIGPQIENRKWAEDDASIRLLRDADLIETSMPTIAGNACIKNREIGEFVGEFFFGRAKNPLRGSIVLPPSAKER